MELLLTDTVFPAYAGMSRRGRLGGPGEYRFPRLRGDEPRIT